MARSAAVGPPLPAARTLEHASGIPVVAQRRRLRLALLNHATPYLVPHRHRALRQQQLHRPGKEQVWVESAGAAPERAGRPADARRGKRRRSRVSGKQRPHLPSVWVYSRVLTCSEGMSYEQAGGGGREDESGVAAEAGGGGGGTFTAAQPLLASRPARPLCSSPAPARSCAAPASAESPRSRAGRAGRRALSAPAPPLARRLHSEACAATLSVCQTAEVSSRRRGRRLNAQDAIAWPLG